MGIKANVEGVLAAMGQEAMPAALMIGSALNMTAFAALGHGLWLIPYLELSDAVKSVRPGYVQSIGGSQDIAAFGRGGSIEGKGIRTKVLYKYAANLSYDDRGAVAEAIKEASPFVLASRQAEDPGAVGGGLGAPPTAVRRSKAEARAQAAGGGAAAAGGE